MKKGKDGVFRTLKRVNSLIKIPYYDIVSEIVPWPVMHGACLCSLGRTIVKEKARLQLSTPHLTFSTLPAVGQVLRKLPPLTP